MTMFYKSLDIHTYVLNNELLFMAEYVGCFTDDSSRLYDFPSREHGWDPSDQTIAKCTSYCKSNKYIYSGIEVNFHNRRRKKLN